MTFISTNPVPAPARARMRPGALVMVLLGALAVLIGGGLALGGAAVAALAGLQHDGNFLNTSTERFEFDSYALTTPKVEGLRSSTGPVSLPAGIATLRLRATGVPTGRAIFIGVARQADVDAYLSSVHHTELVDVSTNPFRAGYRDVEGTSVPVPPVSERFWATSASGAGTQEIVTDLGSGSWAVVVMNADASPAGAVDLQAGFRSNLFAPIGLTLLVSALVLAIIGIPLVLAGAVGLGRGLDPGGIGGPGPVQFTAPLAGQVTGPERDFFTYPARLSGYPDPGLSRWFWLVKWFLALPHFVVLLLLWVACLVCTVAAGIVILFSGRYPRSLFTFTVGVFRWTWRVQFYASALGTDRYPPFTLASVSSFPADFQVPYPAHLGRGLVLVKWWLLALPHLLIVAGLTGAWSWTIAVGTGPGGFLRGSGVSVLSLLVLIAGCALLFSARYPRPLFDLVVGIHRWVYRVMAYVFLLRDEYPPFRLDQGPEDPRDETATGETLSTATPNAPTGGPPMPPAFPGQQPGRGPWEGT
jgi:hypothetical protein